VVILEKKNRNKQLNRYRVGLYDYKQTDADRQDKKQTNSRSVYKVRPTKKQITRERSHLRDLHYIKIIKTFDRS